LEEKVEAIMKKFGEFIPLSSNPEWADSKDEISPVGTTQELWVEVMGNNPSSFKEMKYCPDTYKEVLTHGVRVGMCPDFPVETVGAVNPEEKCSWVGPARIVRVQK
jgi:hypothetical protein